MRSIRIMGTIISYLLNVNQLYANRLVICSGAKNGQG